MQFDQQVNDFTQIRTKNMLFGRQASDTLAEGLTSWNGKKKRTVPKIEEPNRDEEIKRAVSAWADDIISKLQAEFPNNPTCKRNMLSSNVLKGYWMHFPVDFSRSYMPKQDKRFILVDEYGSKYPTTYLVNQHGLSAGWRSFAIDHKLKIGDILIFQLMDRSTFKVHIVRLYEFKLVEGVANLLHFASSEGKKPKVTGLRSSLKKRMGLTRKPS